MLTVTIRPTQDGTTLRLEGNLSDPWIRDLESLWTHAGDNLLYRPVRVVLDDVLAVDEEGRRMLRRLHEDGAELTAEAGPMKALLREVTDAPDMGAAPRAAVPLCR